MNQECLRMLLFLLLTTPSIEQSCQERKNRADELRSKGETWVMSYECLRDGSYNPIQYDEREKLHYCLDVSGIRISSSVSKLRSCECPRVVNQISLSDRKSVFVPSCNKDGTFRNLQCDASSKRCWCMTNAGENVSDPVPVINYCSCFLKRHQLNKINNTKLYRPLCEADGTYSPLQRHGKLSWCAMAMGKQIGRKFVGKRRCDCIVQREKAFISRSRKDFMPECDTYGNYSPFQCFNNTCWCSKPDGSRLRETDGTSVEACKCHLKKLRLINKGQNKYLPDCSKTSANKRILRSSITKTQVAISSSTGRISAWSIQMLYFYALVYLAAKIRLN